MSHGAEGDDGEESEQEEEDEGDEEGESDEEEDEDEDGEDGPGWDYGWNDDDADDEDLDLSNMNLSSDLIRMMGGTDAQVAAAKAAHTTDWQPPEETGLTNSTAIAQIQDKAWSELRVANAERVAESRSAASSMAEPLDNGGATSSGSCGSGSGGGRRSVAPMTRTRSIAYNNANGSVPAAAPVAAAAAAAVVPAAAAATPPAGAPVEAISAVPLARPFPTIRLVGLLTVPKSQEKELPPRPAGSVTDGGDEDDDRDEEDGSDDDWDEASWKSWSEPDSDAEPENLERLSPNLLRLLGKEDMAVAKEMQLIRAGSGVWTAPAISGLANSRRIVQLVPVRVGGEKNLETREEKEEKDSRTGGRGGGGGGGEEAGDADGDDNASSISHGSWGDEEEYDLQVVDDETYIAGWKTNISKNLRSILGLKRNTTLVASSLGLTGWQPPAKPGLANSPPLMPMVEAIAAAAAVRGGSLT